MNNFEITKLMDSHSLTRNVFVSVHAADTLPKSSRHLKPCAYIANTDKASQPGKHWVCFYFPKYSIPEYFDSYGVHPNIGFETFLDGNYVKNITFIQHPQSTVCGQYAMFYILQRCHGYSIREIVRMFDKENLIENDVFVNNVVNNNFGKDLEVFDSYFINKQINQALL